MGTVRGANGSPAEVKALGTNPAVAGMRHSGVEAALPVSGRLCRMRRFDRGLYRDGTNKSAMVRIDNVERQSVAANLLIQSSANALILARSSGVAFLRGPRLFPRCLPSTTGSSFAI